MSIICVAYLSVGLGYGIGRYTLVKKSSIKGWLVWPVGLYVAHLSESVLKGFAD